jgi:hypothetical protein
VATLGQTPLVYVANQQGIFGPLSVGDFPPLGWTIKCLEPLFDINSYYYARWGLEVSTPTSDAMATATGALKGHIFQISASLEETYFPQEKCMRQDGTLITTPVTVHRPAGVVFVSDRGVQLGASLENLIAAHGAPQETTNYTAQKVAFVFYCGLIFHFNEYGRLDRITVGYAAQRPKGC